MLEDHLRGDYFIKTAGYFMKFPKISSHQDHQNDFFFSLHIKSKTTAAVPSAPNSDSAPENNSATDINSASKYDFALKYEFFWKMDGGFDG